MPVYRLDEHIGLLSPVYDYFQLAGPMLGMEDVSGR